MTSLSCTSLWAAGKSEQPLAQLEFMLALNSIFNHCRNIEIVGVFVPPSVVRLFYSLRLREFMAYATDWLFGEAAD